MKRALTNAALALACCVAIGAASTVFGFNAEGLFAGWIVGGVYRQTRIKQGVAA